MSLTPDSYGPEDGNVMIEFSSLNREIGKFAEFLEEKGYEVEARERNYESADTVVRYFSDDGSKFTFASIDAAMASLHVDRGEWKQQKAFLDGKDLKEQ